MLDRARSPVIAPPPSSLAAWSLAVLTITAACEAAPTHGDGAPLTDHDEPSDLEPLGDSKVDGEAFDPSFIVPDALFEDGAWNAENIQSLLENTPYGTKCWLADESVDGQPAATVIHDVAQVHGINPLVLIVRMQVEASLISKATRPRQAQIDRALGCACPDGGGCSTGSAGLRPQLECAARTLRDRFDESVDGTGEWRLGVGETTLDGVRVTPRSHATAAHYAYTPWVLPKRGGNWLVWNVIARFRAHLGDG